MGQTADREGSFAEPQADPGEEGRRQRNPKKKKSRKERQGSPRKTGTAWGPTSSARQPPIPSRPASPRKNWRRVSSPEKPATQTAAPGFRGNQAQKRSRQACRNLRFLDPRRISFPLQPPRSPYGREPGCHYPLADHETSQPSGYNSLLASGGPGFNSQLRTYAPRKTASASQE